ncbi:MAG: hypothetical protein J7L14_02005, partial [Candidatus Diapherotrites archaeon]|nr:hypothetical protein [Candidatus Diapherotrites archaeon]
MGIYSALEEKYYAFLDWLNNYIPVYGIVDRIDRIFPSFILFIIVVLAILGYLIFSFALPTISPATANLKFIVTDTEGNPLSEALIELQFPSGERKAISTNNVGESDVINLARGTTIKAIIEKEGFTKEEKMLTVSEDQTIEIKLKPEASEEEIIEYTIRLLDDETQQPIRKPATIYFQCSNYNVSVEPVETTNGIATVRVRSNCGRLSVYAIDVEGYELSRGGILAEGDNRILLAALANTIENAEIIVNVSYNGAPVVEPLTIRLLRSGIEVSTAETFNGQAVFEDVAPAEYTVQVLSSERYAGVYSDPFVVESGEIKRIALEVRENVHGRIQIKVKDSLSNANVEGANVSLIRDNQIIERKLTDSNGIATFYVSEDVEYAVTVDHEDYCLTTRYGIRIQRQPIIISIDRFTPACGSDLNVQVIYPDGRPVINATVGIYTEDGFSIGIAAQHTNSDGIAEFRRLKSGMYKAFAFKGIYSNWSEPYEFNARTVGEKKIIVTLAVPQKTIRIAVRNTDNAPVPIANVSFYEADTQHLIGGGSMPTDGNGIIEFSTYADKKVFFVISKEGYANYISKVYNVSEFPSELKVTMEKPLLGNSPAIEEKGIFDKQGNSVLAVAPGNTYFARFLLKTPVGINTN